MKSIFAFILFSTLSITTFAQNQDAIFGDCKDAEDVQFCHEKNLQQYLINCPYPPEAAKDMVSEEVEVKLVIDKKGNIKEATANSNANEHLAKAAEEYVMKMPQWTPAKKAGNDVESKTTVKIVFEINEVHPPEGY